MNSALLLAGVCALAACQKEPANGFTGTYTYKTSGTVVLESREEDPAERHTVTLNLVNEEGQMTLAEQAGDKILVACNAIGGDAYSFTATVDEDDTLLIGGTPHKSIAVKSASLTVGHGNVSFGGSAKRYDDVLTFSIDYTGSVSLAGIEMDIIDSEVEILAKKN